MRLDHLRLFAIKQRQLTARPAFGTEQLVEFGVDRLGVPVFGWRFTDSASTKARTPCARPPYVGSRRHGLWDEREL